jgi:signal transduction histidine kinase
MKVVGWGPTLGFALAFIVLIGNAVLSYYNRRVLHDNDQRVARSYAVLADVESLYSALQEAETGQRGYLITGLDRYLAPYRDADTRAHALLASLERDSADHPAQLDALPLLRQKIGKKFDELNMTIALRQRSFEAARQLVLTDQGRRLMDEIRDILEGMRERERGRLRERSEVARRSYLIGTATNLAGVTVTVGVVAGAFVLAWRELLARARAEQGLLQARGELEDRVRERTAELQRSNRELEQFASVASHDLQEPLRKVQAFGDRLHARYASALGEQGGDYLARMQAAAARMSKLINDLLAFSRVTTRGQPFVPTDLNVVAREVVDDLEERIAQAGGKVEVGPLPTLHVDPLQARQLLQNLIANALKFHKPGEPPVVRLGASGPNEAGEWALEVSDNGIGFEEQYRDRIFGLFQRLHGRLEYEGTGLGLAICRKIAERHGGQITAHSAPGLGATFVVTLPDRKDVNEEVTDGQKR